MNKLTFKPIRNKQMKHHLFKILCIILFACNSKDYNGQFNTSTKIDSVPFKNTNLVKVSLYCTCLRLDDFAFIDKEGKLKSGCLTFKNVENYDITIPYCLKYTINDSIKLRKINSTFYNNSNIVNIRPKNNIDTRLVLLLEFEKNKRDTLSYYDSTSMILNHQYLVEYNFLLKDVLRGNFNDIDNICYDD